MLQSLRWMLPIQHDCLLGYRACYSRMINRARRKSIVLRMIEHSHKHTDENRNESKNMLSLKCLNMDRKKRRNCDDVCIIELDVESVHTEIHKHIAAMCV